MSDPRACPACGATARAPWLVARDELLGGPRRWPLTRCRGCGLGGVDPLPTPAELDAAYPRDFDPYVKPYKPVKPLSRLARAVAEETLGWPRRGPAPGGPGRWLARVVARLAPLRHPPFRGQGRWLDVGCGAGIALHRVGHLEPAFRPSGLERSAEAAARARGSGLDVRQAEFPATGLPGRAWDVVTLSHVLEHIPDPLAALREVRRLLAPGGCAVVAVPNRAGAWARLLGARWQALDVPRHLWHFTPAALRRIAQRAGFAVRAIRHEGTQGPWDVWKRDLVLSGWLPAGRSWRGAWLRAPIRAATAVLDRVGGGDQISAILEVRARQEIT